MFYAKRNSKCGMNSLMYNISYNDFCQEKLAKKLDEGQYMTDAKINKLEEILHELRSYTNDVQAVSSANPIHFPTLSLFLLLYTFYSSQTDVNSIKPDT